MAACTSSESVPKETSESASIQCIDTNAPHIVFFLNNSDCASCKPFFGETVLKAASEHAIPMNQIAMICAEGVRLVEMEKIKSNFLDSVTNEAIHCIVKNQPLIDTIRTTHQLNNGSFWALVDSTGGCSIAENFK